jgi:hypothetical protein
MLSTRSIGSPPLPAEEERLCQEIGRIYSQQWSIDRVGKSHLHDPCALVDLTPLHAMELAPGGRENTQACSRVPPSPSGFSMLWFGPATNPCDRDAEARGR